MRLFSRRPPEPARLLSKVELQDLYDEIFLEPVSADWLMHLLSQVPKAERAHSEWVMCQRTWNRIRRMQIKAMTRHGYLTFFSFEQLAHEPETLYGLPVVIDEMALHINLRRRPDSASRHP